MKKIVFTGGGTAGHVNPNLNIIDALDKYNYEFHYIGTSGIEKEIVTKHGGIIFHEITATKFERRLTLKNLTIPFKLLSSKKQALKILQTIQPDLIFSKGGYVTVPVAMAGKKLKLPIIAHESDMTLGLANKIVYHYANTMCFSFDKNVHKYPKGVFTGSPLPVNQIHKKPNFIFKKHTLLNPNLPKVLVFGGSLGAKAINKAILDSLDSLTKKYNIIHVVGKNNVKHTKHKGYVEMGYVENLLDYMYDADIIISRAGSNSVFEILSNKKPNILIPLPKDCSRGDQLENAKYMAENGYSVVLKQEDLTPTTLLDKIDTVQNNKSTYINNMKNAKGLDGTMKIKKIIEDAMSLKKTK